MGVIVVGDVLALLDFIRKTQAEWNVKVAHFDGSGQKLRGDTDFKK